MKKWPVLLLLCAALSACQLYEADMDEAAAKRAAHRDAYHREFGCQLSDNHAAYRECILKTYERSKPKTYWTQNNAEGQPMAVVRDETTASYDPDKNTYKTERVIVIETEERLEPLPVAAAIPYTVEKLTEEPVEQEPVPVAETPAEPEKTAEPEPAEPEKTAESKPAEPTWWETHEKVEKPTEPVCPCEDPNDPCPQCVDK